MTDGAGVPAGFRLPRRERRKGARVPRCTACDRPIPRGRGARAGGIRLGNVCGRCLRRTRLDDGTVVFSARNGPTIRMGGPRVEEWAIPLRAWFLAHRSPEAVVEVPGTRRERRLADLVRRGVARA
jgi:hypothetical protein